MKYHHFQRYFTYPVTRAGARAPVASVLARRARPAGPSRGQCQMGSLAGAAHLLKDNAGVLRRAQRERKSRAEQKGICPLDSDFQCKYELSLELIDTYYL